ncbi:MAG: shikimate dehydrogenase family protein [Actinomycetota bacterium]
MRTFELFGHGIGYTASPLIHRAAFAHLGVADRYGYVVTDVSPEDFPRELARFRTDGAGANVTIPLKALAAAGCDELTEDARLLDAANTIVRTGDRLTGHNTDLPAIEEEIRALCPDWVRHAVVLGGGATSSAVQIALFHMDAAVTVAQRRDGTLRDVGKYLEHADLLVNTTPVGTVSADSPVDPAYLHENLAVFDLVYRPSPSALVRAARETGARARGGAGMLVGQAWRSLALWLAQDGIEVGPEVAEPMLAALLEDLGARDV